MFKIDAPESGGARTVCVLTFFSLTGDWNRPTRGRKDAAVVETSYILPILDLRRQRVPTKKKGALYG